MEVLDSHAFGNLNGEGFHSAMRVFQDDERK